MSVFLSISAVAAVVSLRELGRGFPDGAAQRGLAADTSQLGVPGSGSLLAVNPWRFGEAGQRWLFQ